MTQQSYMKGVREFLDDLASANPTPGGGAAAAVLGGIGCALASMVGNLTAGKKKYAEVEGRAREIVQDADRLRAELIQLYDEDIAAFDKVSAAMSLPKETDQQKATRTAALQAALKGATLSPLRCAQAALKGLDLSKAIAEIGNTNAISDAGVASLALHAAVNAATLNMRINLALIKDEGFVAEHTKLYKALESRAAELASATREVVIAKL
ncbi:MAG: cyclodeaminase/cyclohydrolase family protein [Planctomycetes bacterium]|nr:cyclodeaminase/cyclohydrolase family protein [Planctomycetota bacterium]NUQ33663.1 cyclodeaminase/cyclohydrolase family protein [Planctomycetaceae bacterium]